MTTPPNVPFTRPRVAVSRHRPAPPQEPLNRRTKIKLLSRTLLDAIDRLERTQRADGTPGMAGLWELGSYPEFLIGLEELRAKARNVANVFWAVYVIGSQAKLETRMPIAENGLDWLEKHWALQELYVPAEITEAAGYPPADARANERPKILTRRRRAFILTGGSGAKHAQKPDLR